MKKGLIFILICSVFSCGKVGLNAQIGEPFIAKVGNSFEFTNDKLNVELIGIHSDSRCPEGTNCIWQGQVVIDLKVNNSNIFLNSLNSIDTLGYKFTILEVKPKKTINEISTSDYELKIIISK